MKKIAVLDQNTIDKIAAGEVVERPSSVVKELVENAIDAGATAITVEITDGGKKLIRITDNGSGMDAEQVPLAFLRHATSKIEKVEDLTHIASLGFRGEALSSIAAVSQVELITKTPSGISGTRYVIEGGQTMNPSTDDVLSAIEQVNAENIFVLPNNGNIILAANQAKNLTEDKEVYVVPSKNIPQGIAAMISFVSGRSAAENAESMEEEMQLIKSGQVTYAVRDTNMDGKDIKQGDFMGLTDKTIVSVGSDLQGTAKELIESLLDEDSELVSLYYGSDATKEQAEQLAEDIENTHEDVEVEVQYGGQPVYSYFISVE